LFVTRATRHDKADIEELLASLQWEVKDPASGTFFLAREGAAIGCIRLCEVAPQTLVVRDMVVAAHRRGEGIGTQLMRGAMNSRGGTLYLRCSGELVPYFERFGFASVAGEELPQEVAGHFDGEGPSEQATTMKAR
jgi:N-acetylglutamate synthase-like GNAT family acetyltransferase